MFGSDFGGGREAEEMMDAKVVISTGAKRRIVSQIKIAQANGSHRRVREADLSVC
jgi:hypothetical protein